MSQITTDTYSVPVDIIAAASTALFRGRVNAQLLDGDEDSGTVKLRITSDEQNPLHRKAMENFRWMISQYNGYRHGDTENNGYVETDLED
ncbi:MAG: hypothetical protein H6585_09295 [Flavobacteriales bacterium]|nr:hypothetical protein [Flavobacteriales bacterium]MCB9448523.1 hypothetical protein [Flavobacteriales bacterium]